MIMPIDRVLPQLAGVKGGGGQEQWIALCPGHDDRSQSLSVSVGEGQRVLLHCHAGCSLNDILSSLGLQLKDLFVDKRDELSREQRLRLVEIEQERHARVLKEHAERLGRLEKLRQSNIHMRYHRALTVPLRGLWWNEGIYDEAIDRFMLGWTDSCPTAKGKASVTIPVFGYENTLMNIRHRLLDPGGHGRYRPQMSGLGNHLFNAPILNSSHERVLVMEGEKKAIVYDQAGYPTVGIMGKANGWDDEWIKWFDAGQIIMALDPDAEENAFLLGRSFLNAGFKDVRVAAFPMKPDDWIVLGGAGQKDVEDVLKWARPIRRRK